MEEDRPPADPAGNPQSRTASPVPATLQPGAFQVRSPVLAAEGAVRGQERTLSLLLIQKEEESSGEDAPAHNKGPHTRSRTARAGGRRLGPTEAPPSPGGRGATTLGFHRAQNNGGC